MEDLFSYDAPFSLRFSEVLGGAGRTKNQWKMNLRNDDGAIPPPQTSTQIENHFYGRLA
jgi:hypothetical protein